MRRHGFGTTLVRVFFLFFIISLFSSCAPKKVRIFDGAAKIRGDVVSSALALQGKPYRNGAKGPDAFDCSGLIYFVFKRHRILLPPPAESQGRAGYEVNRINAQPGDIVFFSVGGAFHVGILVNRTEFVHASSSRGVTVDSVDADYWRKRLLYYRSVL